MACLPYELPVNQHQVSLQRGGTYSPISMFSYVLIYVCRLSFFVEWILHNLKMYFLLKIVIFQCHVSFQGCTSADSFRATSATPTRRTCMNSGCQCPTLGPIISSRRTPMNQRLRKMVDLQDTPMTVG